MKSERFREANYFLEIIYQYRNGRIINTNLININLNMIFQLSRELDRSRYSMSTNFIRAYPHFSEYERFSRDFEEDAISFITRLDGTI